MSDTAKLNQPTTSYQTRPREAVLIVAHGDGWIEAFAERHIDVRIEIAPHVPTPEGERLAEEYVELCLPQRFRVLFWPGLRRAADQVRIVRPSDIALQKWNLELLHEIQGVNSQQNATEGTQIWIS